MKKLVYSIFCVVVFACGGGVQAVDPNAGKTGDTSLNEGLQYYKVREYDKAKALLNQSLGLNLSRPNCIAAHKHLAFIAAIQSDSSEATRQFFEALKLDKDFTLDKAEMGNPYWTPALESAQKQYGLLTQDSAELFKMGKSLYEKREYVESQKYFDAALAKYDLSFDNKVQSYKYLAFIYSIQKKNDYAVTAFRNAFKLDKHFELDKGEYGNPLWTPLFEQAKVTLNKKDIKK